MPRWRLVPTRRFERDFVDLPRDVQGKVLKALERLRRDPSVGRKLVGVRVGQWRYRVGDYRIRYDLEGDSIVLHLVRHRGDVYRA